VIYAVTFASSALNSFAGPARQALIPNLVPRNEIAGAATMANLAMQAAMVAGPAIGGILIAQTSLSLVYGMNAIGFVAVIAAALAIKARPEITVQRERGFTAIKAGFVFLWQTPILLAVMGLDFIATFFGAFTNLLPIFADEIFGGGANRLGLLLSAPAAGAVLGSVLFGIIRMPVRPGLGMVACVIAYGACIVGFGASSTLWMALLFLAGTGAADSISMALRHTIRNLVTPDSYRGRIASAHSIFAMGGPQLGEFRAGAMASGIGAPLAVVIGGIGTVMAAIGAARLVPQLTHRLVDMPDPEGEPSGSKPAVG
jgi:MFS family permease